MHRQPYTNAQEGPIYTANKVVTEGNNLFYRISIDKQRLGPERAARQLPAPSSLVVMCPAPLPACISRGSGALPKTIPCTFVNEQAGTIIPLKVKYTFTKNAAYPIKLHITGFTLPLRVYLDGFIRVYKPLLCNTDIKQRLDGGASACPVGGVVPIPGPSPF